MKFWSVVFALLMVVASLDVEAARRFGGGRSFGKQSNNVTQREAAQPAPRAPAANPTNAANVAPKRPWGAMLGGIAAGLGLAWLASSLGLGEAFGQIILIALLATIVMVVVARLMRRSKPTAGEGGAPFAFQGAGGAGAPVTDTKRYRPENVGNDASARPWERGNMLPDSGGNGAAGSMIGSALSGSQTWGIPEGFDVQGFVSAARSNFVTLQAAWDKADMQSLRAMMTDDMLKEIQSQLSEREIHSGRPMNQTDVVVVDAKLLGIEDLGDSYMASVEFAGMIREEPSSSPNPFREVWNMTKPKNGSSGWLVAGVQALQ